MKLQTVSISKNKTPLLPNLNKSDNGYTLFEVIIVIAIITGLFAIGSFVDLSIINRRSISAEQAVLISVLQKARNQAMNNIDALPHGVRIESDKYIVFSGPDYLHSSKEEPIQKNSTTTISGINDIIFEQLTGNSSPTGDIILTNNVDTKKIMIREGGLIDW